MKATKVLAFSGLFAAATAGMAAGMGAAASAACLSPAGDVTANGTTAVEDVQCTVLAVLWSLGGATETPPVCIKAPGAPSLVVDHNCDRLITIVDATLAIRFALGEPLSSNLDANGNQCVDACEADQDQDGTDDPLDCAPLDAGVAPGKPELCNGWDDDCNGVIDDFGTNNPGGGCEQTTACVIGAGCQGLPAGLGLVITEAMIDPTAVGDAQGEWFELYNPTAATVNIQGWTLRDNSGETHLIDAGAALIVPAGAAVVLGNDKTLLLNGGVVVAYEYKAFTLDNLSDSIQLVDKANTVRARLDYGPGFPVQAGRSLARASWAADPSTPAAWAASTAAYGAGDKGTPWGPNSDVLTSLCAGGTPVNCDDGNPCTQDSCSTTSGQCTHAPAAGAACSDGNSCTTGDACTAQATCVGQQKSCGDGNPCTADSCNPSSGQCANTPQAGLACSDGSACTSADACSAQGQCVGQLIACADGNPCTDDACDPAAGCVFTPNTAPCSDANACTQGDICQSGFCAPGAPLNCGDANPCTADVCNPGAGGCAHTPLAGTDCSDGNPCTVNDTCSAQGQCVGLSKQCDDGKVCTADSCNAATGACVFTPMTNQPCDDGNACTQGDACSAAGLCVSAPVVCNDAKACTDDSCNPASGCVYTNNAAACSDGNPCTQGDVCAGGACVGGAPINCGDGNPCTADSCSPASSGCVHTPLPGQDCSDGNACSVNDTCTAQGICVGVAKTCNDDNPCTSNGCNASTGACQYTPQAGQSCSDSNPCTSNDACTTQGACTGAPVSCADGNPCTDDSCNPLLGCVFAPNTATCSDSNACTVGDSCVQGVCVAGLLKNCGDGNSCTADSCAPQTGQCANAPQPGADCSDNDPCTTNDTCNAAGQCGGVAKVCNDGNSCTADSCNAQNGTCSNIPLLNQPCNDNNPCTSNDACNSQGICAGVGLVCNDGNPCTDDSCHPSAGCMYSNNSATCTDGNPCTQGEQCANGVCQAGTTKNCGDSNPCTVDSCNSTTGACVNTPQPGLACSDGSACTSSDACTSQGTCAGTAVTCNDNNVCTNDTCSPASGCQFTHNTAPCSDGNGCTSGDVCGNGSCKSGPLVTCNDNNPCTSDSCNPATGQCAFTPTGQCSTGCSPSNLPTCNGCSCQACVCQLDPTCCSAAWDADCAALCDCDCGGCGASCGDGCCETQEGETTSTCAADCTGAGSCCASKGTPGCESKACQSCVCPGDTFCCTTAWDSICATTANTTCKSSCPGCCGNGTCNPGETCATCPGDCGSCCGNGVCDNGETCDSCPGDCGKCSCCQVHGTPGCNQPGCENCVCAVDPFCCNSSWDSICLGEAQSDCGSEICACGSTTYAGAGCGVASSTGCGGCPCQDCVCALDAFCCDTSWDSICVGECNTECGFLCYQGNCCASNGSPGCDTPTCVSCVCAADPFCCNTTWDAICGSRANDECVESCPQCNTCGNGDCGPGEDCCDCDQDCGGFCFLGLTCL